MINPELEQFVHLIGGIRPAYEHLGCSYDQLYKMRKGYRTVTKDRAKTIINKFPNLSLSKLLFPEDQVA